MLVRRSAPEGLAVSVATAKQRLRVDDADNDADIERMIRAATERFERRTGRILLPAEFEYQIASWWCPLAIPVAPIRSVSEVVYLDQDHAEQAVDPSDWHMVKDRRGATIFLGDDYSWPTLSNRNLPVRVRFEAGYDVPGDLGEDPELHPRPIDQQAILMLVAHWFMNRETPADKSLTSIPGGFEAIVAERRIYR